MIICEERYARAVVLFTYEHGAQAFIIFYLSISHEYENSICCPLLKRAAVFEKMRMRKK